MKPPFGLLNMTMNNEPEMTRPGKWGPGIHDLELENIDEVLAPSDLDKSLEGQESVIGKGAGLLAATYGTALTAKHGLKHLTPVTQFVSRPLKEASTYIKTFYSPEVQANPIEQKKLVYDHWKEGDRPGVKRYLREYRNRRDPFGIWWNEEMVKDKHGVLQKPSMVTENNMRRFDKFLKKYGGNWGIETADEAYYKSLQERAEIKYADIEFSNRPDKEQELKTQRKRIKDARNNYRYEVQKTELMKQTFGESVDKKRWKNAGLGKIVKTDLKTALKGDRMAISGWTKQSKNASTSKKVKNFFKSALTPETRVTASYLEGDHRMLMKEAKGFGQFFDTTFHPGIQDQEGFNPRYRKSYGYIGRAGKEEGLAEQIYKLHERGYDYKQVHAHFKSQRDWLIYLSKGKDKRLASNAIKSLNALDQLLNNYTFKNGVLEVPYSFVSQQKAIAGVNSSMTLWRGKGSSVFGKKRVESERILDKYRKGVDKSYGTERANLKTTPGKLHHKILVSDVYDVAGAPEGMLKNVHVNIAHTDTSGGIMRDRNIASKKPTMKVVQKLMKNKEYRELYEMLPKMSKRAAKKAAMFLVFKRF